MNNNPPQPTDSNSFYAKLAPLYHLIYPDWPASIRRQATALDAVIRDQWGSDANLVLDVSCGIGTQALGLAERGYTVTASDLSSAEIERAKAEATHRNLHINFSVADMRDAYSHHNQQFDVVLSCDNSVPHLLTDAEILTAFQQFYRCTRPGGGCIISVRDYANDDISQRQIKPYGIRDDDDVRWLLWQVWDPWGDTYMVTFYLVEDRGTAGCHTHTMRTRYYAVHITKLMTLLTEAGFDDVRRLDEPFFQPIIVGSRKTS